ncbi:MAG TPA: CSLREA domain-containing protein [Isosphaeraceae bacterium]
MIGSRTPRRLRTAAPSLHLGTPLDALEARRLMAVFTVNSLADILSPPAGTVTLRSAIQAANTSPGTDVINLAVAGTYKITTIGTATDNSAGELAIADNGGLTIQNSSGGLVTIAGNGVNLVFDVNPAGTAAPFTVAFSSLVVTGGAANTAAGGGGIDAHGGASLSLSGCVVSRNIASTSGGGIAMEANDTGNLTLASTQVNGNLAGFGTGGGGGIAGLGTGTVTIGSRSLIADNTSSGPQGGGGVVVNGAPLVVAGSTISGNRSLAGPGGGIGQLGGKTVTITGSLVQNNFSQAAGGGYGDAGGAAALTVTNSFFLNNAAVANGGGISANGMLAQLVNTTLAGNSTQTSGGGGDFNATVTIHVTDCTVSGNTTRAAGAGLSAENITQFTITTSTFTGNLAFGNGGGVSATFTGAGTISVNDCLFSGNTTVNVGAGLFTSGGTATITDSRFTDNAAAVGGGIEIVMTVVQISNCTVDGNRASGRAGGIFLNLPAATNSVLLNDTITGNSGGPEGGGIDFFMGTGTAAITDCTIDGNSATKGGGVFEDFATVNVGGTIIAGNTGTTGPDFDYSSGSVNDKGGNLLGNPTGDGAKFGAGTIIGDPKLGPLVNNGGQSAGAPSTSQVVPTQALLPGSPAFAKGLAGPATDERGFGRPTKPSIGAYEPQYAANATPNQVFVENMYEVLFNQVADPIGLANSTAFLNKGGTPMALVQILQSFLPYLDNVTVQLYRRYLDRAPSGTELNIVVNFLQAGTTPEQLAVALIGSNEFTNDYGGGLNDVFVEALFVATLGRPTASQADLTAWDVALGAGFSRAAVGNLLLTSTEYITDLIVDDFDHYVGRPASASDLAAFRAASAAGASSTALAAVALAGSFPART